jgi:hypothetical protein
MPDATPSPIPPARRAPLFTPEHACFRGASPARTVVACLALVLLGACGGATMPDRGTFDAAADRASEVGGDDEGLTRDLDGASEATADASAPGDAAATDAARGDVHTEQGEADASGGADGLGEAALDAEGPDALAPADAPGANDGASYCHDNLQDGDETDVDCGGSCPPCWFAQRCRVDADCYKTAPGCDVALGGCTCDTVALTCVASGCLDHHEDGKETGVDCGGGQCSPCALGSSCATNYDCASNACDAVSGTCIASQCADHKRDGNESDTDCGGPCARCALGAHCYYETDCVSLACDAIAGLCITDACVDHRQDGLETDIDCGGPVCTVRCGSGRYCKGASDCMSGMVCSATSPRICE